MNYKCNWSHKIDVFFRMGMCNAFIFARESALKKLVSRIAAKHEFGVRVLFESIRRNTKLYNDTFAR